MKLQLLFPLNRPHAGVPLANGNFGALVWGKESLCITVNQNDLWDHRGGELIDERDAYANFVRYADTHGCTAGLNKLFHKNQPFTGRPRRLPVGRFELHFSAGIVPVSAELDYGTGSLSVKLSDGAVLTLVLVLKQNILYVSDPGRRVCDISLHPASDFPQVAQFNAARGMGEYELLSDGWRIKPPEDPEFTIHIGKTPCGYKIYSNSDGDDSQMQEQISFTGRWWSEYFAATAKINVPDPWWNRFFTFSVYKFGAMTCPYGKAGGLQGPWHEEYQECKWSGDFHFNVNVQMIYGAACALGVPGHLLKLFDMIEAPEFQAAMRHNARALFQADDALWQTHAVDNRGMQCGWLSCGSSLDPACGAWTALLYYDYFRYTGDKDFLRERAYPYIYGIMRGYECMLDDKLHIPVAISAEYAASNPQNKTIAGRNPSYQLAAIRKLAEILIKCAAILNLPERPVWRKILQHVPHYVTVSGYDRFIDSTVQRIGIWENQDLDVCHRHHSHLGAIWPFDSLPETPDAEMQTVLNNSIDHWVSRGFGDWSEWCIPWANIIYTRMGLREAPMQLFNVWKDIFVNEGLATVYTPRMLSLISHSRHNIAADKAESEVMQMDGSCGFITAFLEMCAYCRFDKVRLFRGIPERWHEVKLENMLLPGGGRLTAEKGGSAVISGGSGKISIAENELQQEDQHV